VQEYWKKAGTFLNQKSSQSPFSKRRMSLVGTGLPPPLSRGQAYYDPRNDRRGERGKGWIPAFAGMT